MRLRDACGIVLVMFVVSACSRLTFIKPNYSKMKVERVSSVPDVHDSAADRARMASEDALMLASNRLQGGDLAGAEQAARAILASNHGSTGANTVLALVEQQRGHAAQAGGYFKQAAELPGAGAAEWGNYGTWMCESGHPAESLAWLDRALALGGNIDVAGMQANAGKCAVRAGQTDRAERDLRAALGVAPLNAAALEGMAQLMLDRGQLMEARAFSERRLGLGNPTPDILRRAAQIESKLGDDAAASRYLDRLRTQSANPSQGQ